MYNLKRNNYNLKPKNSTIYTPPAVSQFIFELLRDKILPSRIIEGKKPLILDPCCGQGNLLEPWQRPEWVDRPKKPVFAKHRCLTYGIDNDETSTANFKTDFLKISSWQDLLCRVGKYPKLVLCNPPFNGYGDQLGSEVWLDKIIELFGKDIPLVLFAPAGFCSNLTLESKRHKKFENGTYPPISSRITLPKNIFEGVVFHSEQSPDSFSEKGLEILIFNIKGLKAYYFLPKYEIPI